MICDTFVSFVWIVQDIPNDPTGQLANIVDFVKDNYEICKWVGLAVVIIEVGYSNSG